MSLSAYILLEPDFTTRERRLISRYLKVKDLIDAIIEGLRKTGMVDLK